MLKFTNSPESWRALLADPDKHWKTGYSARTLAHAWEAVEGFPPEISVAFSRCAALELTNLRAVMAIPEFKVPLPGGARASQNDVFVLAQSTAGPVVVMVEGKVDETFGPTVGEWYAGASEGKKERLEFLLKKLAINEAPPDLRYQLFHRATSALITAEQYRAVAAVMLVHSFSDKRTGFLDYEAFLSHCGAKASFGDVTPMGVRDGIPMFAAWVRGDLDFLAK